MKKIFKIILLVLCISFVNNVNAEENYGISVKTILTEEVDKYDFDEYSLKLMDNQNEAFKVNLSKSNNYEFMIDNIASDDLKVLDVSFFKNSEKYGYTKSIEFADYQYNIVITIYNLEKEQMTYLGDNVHQTIIVDENGEPLNKTTTTTTQVQSTNRITSIVSENNTTKVVEILNNTTKVIDVNDVETEEDSKIGINVLKYFYIVVFSIAAIFILYMLYKIFTSQK